jgi:hypothetical protein
MVNKPVVKNVLGTRQLILCTSLLPQALDTRQTHTIPFPISPPLYTAPSPRCTLYPPLPPSALHTHSACHDCPGVCMYVLTRVPGPPTGVTRLGSPASPLMVPVDATCLPGLSRSGGSKPLPSPGGGAHTAPRTDLSQEQRKLLAHLDLVSPHNVRPTSKKEFMYSIIIISCAMIMDGTEPQLESVGRM